MALRAGVEPGVTPGDAAPAAPRYTDHGARLSLQVLMELKNRIVPLPPCLSEDCTCHGVYYKDVCTTSCRMVAILQLNWEHVSRGTGQSSEELRNMFREKPPQIVVAHTGKNGKVTSLNSGRDFEVEATFAAATDESPDQWVLFFRPNITTHRLQALCHLRVGDGDTNFVDLALEIRSKPSKWLVVENIPHTWDMNGLETFLRHFCDPKQIRCTVCAPHTAFVQLEKRPLATSIMDTWAAKAPALLDALHAQDLVVSWTMNLNKPCAADRPFAPGSGWKPPAECRIGRVYQDGGDVRLPTTRRRPTDAADDRAHPAKRARHTADQGGAAHPAKRQRTTTASTAVAAASSSSSFSTMQHAAADDVLDDFDFFGLANDMGFDMAPSADDDDAMALLAAAAPTAPVPVPVPAVAAGAGAGAGAGAVVLPTFIVPPRGTAAAFMTPAFNGVVLPYLPSSVTLPDLHRSASPCAGSPTTDEDDDDDYYDDDDDDAFLAHADMVHTV